MAYFLVEIRMNGAGQLDVERAARTLEAAQTRLRRTATATRTLIAGLAGDDGRLVCLIEATSLDTVRRLVGLALLPAGRIREITHLTGAPHVGLRTRRLNPIAEVTTPCSTPRRQC